MYYNEYGYLHGPYSPEDVMTEGFMDKFILHQKHVKRLGDRMLKICELFDKLYKKRVRLENYNFKHNGLTQARQQEWDELEPQYVKTREERTQSMQQFMEMCKHEKIEIPEYIQKLNWLTI